MNWQEFTQTIFDSSEGTSEIVWGASKLKSVAIPRRIMEAFQEEQEMGTISPETQARIFHVWGLDGYLQRPNCPSVEELLVNINMRMLTSKSCVS